MKITNRMILEYLLKLTEDKLDDSFYETLQTYHRNRLKPASWS